MLSVDIALFLKSLRRSYSVCILLFFSVFLFFFPVLLVLLCVVVFWYPVPKHFSLAWHLNLLFVFIFWSSSVSQCVTTEESVSL